MLVVHVHVHVKPECVASFRELTLANANASVKEAGVARFDVLQSNDDPTRFLLVEVYRSLEAPAAHKQTAHYAAWAAGVVDMMAEPRVSSKFQNLFPDDEGW